jgi:hypothetical protein
LVVLVQGKVMEKMSAARKNDERRMWIYAFMENEVSTIGYTRWANGGYVLFLKQLLTQ